MSISLSIAKIIERNTTIFPSRLFFVHYSAMTTAISFIIAKNIFHAIDCFSLFSF